MAEAKRQGRRVDLEAPAKINLGLRILGTRPDGYHVLESLFAPLDLADSVEIEVGESDDAIPAVTLELCGETGPNASSLRGIPTDDRNLAVRAARGFLAQSGAPCRVSIRLTKRIPAAAGLGGGSSDAGAVLRGLSGLHPGAIASERLREIALGLGADVPFFLDPQPALVTGIGEHIAPQAGLPGLWILLVNPGDSVDTAQVYAAYDALAATLTRATPGSTLRAISDLRVMGEGVGDATGITGRDDSVSRVGRGARATRASGDRSVAWADCLRALIVNDLEAAATRLCPPVGRFKAQLEEVGALATGMSGSGASVFGIFASERAARVAEDRFGAKPGVWKRVVHVGRANRSPQGHQGQP